MYEALLTPKSLSKQTSFCWSAWRIHMTKLNMREIYIFDLMWNSRMCGFLVKLLDFPHKISLNNSKYDCTIGDRVIPLFLNKCVSAVELWVKQSLRIPMCWLFGKCSKTLSHPIYLCSRSIKIQRAENSMIATWRHWSEVLYAIYPPET